jgi:hypothetical protein
MSIEIQKSITYKVLDIALLVALIAAALFIVVTVAVVLVAPGSAMANLSLSLDFDGFSVRSPLNDKAAGTALVPLWSTLSLGVVAIVSVWLLRLVVLSMRQGSPFQIANVRRLRIIGWVWVVQAYLRQAVNWSFARTLLRSQEGAALEALIDPRFNVLPQGLLAAFGLLVIAQVFEFGCRLQREHDETV